MNKADLVYLGEVLEAVSELYQLKREITGTTIKIWFNALQRFELKDIKRAISIHVGSTESGQYFPKPADIIRILEGGADDKAAQAWAKLERTIRTVSPYNSLTIHDPIMACIVEREGGWKKLCEVKPSELPFLQSRFMTQYRAATQRDEQHQSQHFPGLTESYNQAHGVQGLFETYELSNKLKQLGSNHHEIDARKITQTA